MNITRVLLLLAALLLHRGAARADESLEYEVTGSIGSVLVAADDNTNLQDPQLAGSAEAIWNNIVMGLRVTRTFNPYDPCVEVRFFSATEACPPRNARTIGVDGGYEWDLKPLHFSPRLGAGYIDSAPGAPRAFYLEPGFVLSAQFGAFTIGMDVRYRTSSGYDGYRGLVEYLRLGIRL